MNDSSSPLLGARRRLAIWSSATLGISVLITTAGVAGCLEPVYLGGATSSDSDATGQGVQIGAPCIPSDENSPQFKGYKVTGITLESGAPQCGGGTCMVNHFQGRVTCPLGQPQPKDENGYAGCVPSFVNGDLVEGKGTCKTGDLCVGTSVSLACDPSQGEEANQLCASAGQGAQCSPEGFCQCDTDADCISAAYGIVACVKHECLVFACHTPGDCQSASAASPANAGHACCLPGTDKPAINGVCGECKGSGGWATRSAEEAVYCTCRCGLSDGAPEDPSAELCTCPDGFECSEVFPWVGLGDPQVAGKYCIKAGTAYDPDLAQCGEVDGYWAAGADSGLSCEGVPTGYCQGGESPCPD